MLSASHCQKKLLLSPVYQGSDDGVGTDQAWMLEEPCFKASLLITTRGENVIT